MGLLLLGGRRNTLLGWCRVRSQRLSSAHHQKESKITHRKADFSLWLSRSFNVCPITTRSPMFSVLPHRPRTCPLFFLKRNKCYHEDLCWYHPLSGEKGPGKGTTTWQRALMIHGGVQAAGACCDVVESALESRSQDLEGVKWWYPAWQFSAWLHPDKHFTNQHILPWMAISAVYNLEPLGEET